YFDQMNSDRHKIPYDIDGLVYRVDEFQYYNKLGYTSKSPKWAIAYKFKSLEAMTQILDVTFQVGRTGTITPVAELEPVNIGGVNVSRATLHNFSEIEAKDININDFVYVKRAGDVIPDIDRVELNKRKITKKIIPPKKCPSCNSILSKIDNQVAFKCINNKGCIPQIEQSIIHFISRKAMNIQGIGNQIIKELISKKIIKSSADLFKLSQDDFKKLDRVGDKSINNYLTSINLAKNVMFNKFIYALGIQEVGESSSKSIAKKFNSIDEFVNCNFETLIEINDVGPIVANNIMTYLDDKDNKSNIKNLISHGINIIYEKATKSQKLTNVVITGTFNKYSRSELVDTLEANGYKITSNISNTTNLLICGDNPGSKFNKALDYEIKIIYEKELLKLLSKFH
ncbi:MAG: NAD-dependent DNA ligase LigA, partial [Candidatus Kariarchaeum pelagius]